MAISSYERGAPLIARNVAPNGKGAPSYTPTANKARPASNQAKLMGNISPFVAYNQDMEKVSAQREQSFYNKPQGVSL